MRFPKFRFQNHPQEGLLLALAFGLLLTPGASPRHLLHGVALIDPNAPQPRVTAHLNYYGGPVVSNARIVMVTYGAGTYLGNISGSSSPTMASFYQQVATSAYIAGLNEYNTNIKAKNGQQGTNQTIGAGTFAGAYAITPAAAHNGSSISDASIQAELAAQIDAGILPAPDANTIYMVHFPHSKSIHDPSGSGSCVAGGFCAYHSNFVHNSKNIYYGVNPDMTAGSGCDAGCGGSTPFNNQTSVSSHELVEAITDAQVGSATNAAPPLAWYDLNNGEIGDICNAVQGAILGGDGVTYTVQKQWSNAHNACYITPPPPVADYYVDAAMGSDSNAGTAALPFKTVTKAIAVAAAGNTIHIKAGNYGGDKPRITKNLKFTNWTSAGQSRIGQP